MHENLQETNTLAPAGDTTTVVVEPVAEQPVTAASPVETPVAETAESAPEGAAESDPEDAAESAHEDAAGSAREGASERSGRRRRNRGGGGQNNLPIRVIPPKKVVRVLSVGMPVEGVVRRVADFGAFIDIGVGTDGLVHISELSVSRVGKVSDRLKEGDQVTAWIKELNRERNRISLTLVEPGTKTIRDLQEGEVVKGKVTRVVPYAAFLDIGVGRDAMLHIREMSNGFVRRVEDVANVGDELEAKVISLDRRRQRIDLSRKELEPPAVEAPAPVTPEPVIEESYERPRGSENQGRGRGRGDDDMPEMGGGSRREREPRGGRGGGNGSEYGERRGRRERGSQREREDWNDYLKDNEEVGPTAMALALQAAMGQDIEQESRRQKRMEKDRERRRQDDMRNEQEDIVARTLRLRQPA